MALLDVLDISGMAMTAQSVRMNATASNLANADSVASNTGETYRARRVIFAAAARDAGLEAGFDPVEAPGTAGVRVLGVVESSDPLQLRYEPGHPYADESGYVAYPNVDVVEEMADMISASRSFQMNVEVMNSARTMAERVLDLGQ